MKVWDIGSAADPGVWTAGCSRCGEFHKGGLYVRVDPQTLLCAACFPGTPANAERKLRAERLGFILSDVELP
jgi:hypothetical protein